MKSFQQFLSESITINGNFNGTLNVGGSPQSEPTTESYFADVVWEGKIYRMEIEGSMPSKNELTEQLQGEYPGAIVHNVYPSQENTSRVKNAQRYRPERLSWSD
ncbi:MAG: hypothetical protein EBR50_07775 [Proteobacteria bacterium]|jgi:hypothetical protein|nr:hypothetical protein [Pseudomonadota bacterium]